MYVNFNTDGDFIAYSSIPIPYHSYKLIPQHCRDLSLWKWVGNLEDGKMTLLSESSEIVLKAKTDYPIEVQLNLIMKQLKHIADKFPSSQLDEFYDMADICFKAEQILKNSNPHLNNNHAKTI